MSVSIGEITGSAGRATGRPPPSEVEGREAVAGRELRRAAGFGAAFFVVFARAAVLFFPVLRLAVVFLPPERDAVERFFAVGRFAVLRLVVDFFAVDRLAVDRLAVDFFVDFFFAAIVPPSPRDPIARVWFAVSAAVRCVYSIGIPQTQAPAARFAPTVRGR